MTRPAFVVFLGALAPIALVTLDAGSARGEGASRPARVVEPEDALASVMRALLANEGLVRVGMTAEDADRALPGTAKHLDQRFFPLQGSWLDEEGQMDGTVVWDVDPETAEEVDTICAVLVTGDFDKEEMGEVVVSVGKEIGLTLAHDEEDPDTWYDAEAEGVELWVTLGDGIVVVDSCVVE